MSATPLQHWLHRIEAASSGAFALVGGVAMGLPLAGTAIATGAADVALVALAGAAGAGFLLAGVHRWRVHALPLQISPKALLGRLDGWPVYRFRARLGNGRPVREVRVEVAWEGADGARIDLVPVLARLPAAVGPWTVAVVDRGARCDGSGTFAVRITARERGRTWTAEERFARDALAPGRFEAGVTRQRGRLVWDPAGWDAVRAEAS